MAANNELDNAFKNKIVESQARLDERTLSIKESLNMLAQQHKEGIAQMIGALDKHAKDDTDRFANHSAILETLKAWRWYVLGGAAAMGSILAFILKAG